MDRARAPALTRITINASISPNSVAPTLPGHLGGRPVSGRHAIHGMGARLALVAEVCNRDLVLVGYTLGASIALQYGLDYPEEVRA